jgi:uncharacterized membrane protein
MSAAAGGMGRWIGPLALGTMPFLLHAMVIWPQHSGIEAALLWAAIALVAAVAIALMKRRRMLAILAVAIVVFAHVAQRATDDAVVAAAGIPHSAAYIALLAIFGRSLLPGRTPIVSAISERLSGAPLAPEIARYTRRVTIAWCTFFALQLAVSWTLLAAAPIAVWSLFVNVLNLPAIVLMFLIEYGYRRVRFRNQPHRTILQVIHVLSDSGFRGITAAGSARR